MLSYMYFLTLQRHCSKFYIKLFYMKSVRISISSRLLLLSLVSLIYTSSIGRQDTSRHALILDFYSIGTGAPGDQLLKNFITAYRKKNKIKTLSATRVGGLGREGEYAIIFPLKELSAQQKKLFINALSKALPTLKGKEELGGINLNQNQPFDMSRGRIKPETIVL